MPAAITLNGVDLRTLGYTADRIVGPWDRTGVEVPAVAVPGRAGLLAVANRATVAAQRLEIDGVLVGDTLTQRDTRVRQLMALLGGLVEIKAVANPSIAWVARIASVTETPYQRQYRNGRHATRLLLIFQALDPWGYDVSVQSIAFGTAKTPVPLGVAPSAPLILILGSVTNPTLTYRTLGGLSRCVMGFTITLGANDFLAIDCDAQNITKSVAGTVTSVPDVWTTTTDGFLALDPMDGDPINGGWPTVELSGGTGLLLYRRSW